MRPAIPKKVERELYIESGHRCAVCGTTFPLERAHIIPWSKSKDHSAENLICLCANCHERADKDWDTSTLREYKKRPWVNRQNNAPAYLTKSVSITIDLDIKNFDQSTKKWLQFGLAAFLETKPENVQIKEIREGSVIAKVALDSKKKDLLITEFERGSTELSDFLAPLKIISIVEDYSFEQSLDHAPIDFFSKKDENARRENCAKIIKDTAGMAVVVNVGGFAMPGLDNSSLIALNTRMVQVLYEQYGKVISPKQAHEVLLKARQDRKVTALSEFIVGWIPMFGLGTLGSSTMLVGIVEAIGWLVVDQLEKELS